MTPLAKYYKDTGISNAGRSMTRVLLTPSEALAQTQMRYNTLADWVGELMADYYPTVEDCERAVQCWKDERDLAVEMELTHDQWLSMYGPR